MTRIKVQQFAVLTEAPKEPSTLNLSASIKYDLVNDVLGLQTKISIDDTASEKLLILDLFCEFTFHEEDLAGIKRGDTITFPKQLLDTMLAQCVGTARGIIHCKAEDTPLRDLVLPPMNVTTVFREDITFDKKQVLSENQL